jgi:hypothetical protein
MRFKSERRKIKRERDRKRNFWHERLARDLSESSYRDSWHLIVRSHKCLHDLGQ